MTSQQQSRALDYVLSHLPRKPLPDAVRQALISQRNESNQPTGKPAGGRNSRALRRERNVRAEKLPSGRIVVVRDRKGSPATRRLLMLSAGLFLALASTVTFFITSWSPQFEPTSLRILYPTAAGNGAQAVVLSSPAGMQLVAAGLPPLAPGYRYVAWHSSDEGTTRTGTLSRTANGVYALRARKASGASIRVTIEQTRAKEPTGPVVLEGLTLE